MKKRIDGKTILYRILNRIGSRALNYSGSRYGQVVDSVQHIKEHWGSTKVGTFLAD